MSKIFSRRIYYYFYKLILLLTLSGTANGQLQFIWPENTVQVERYYTLEQCLAGTQRIIKRAAVLQNIIHDLDTMPLHFDGGLTALPNIVKTFAKSCSAKFVVDSFTFDGPWEVFSMLLHISEQSKALNDLIKRRLDMISTSDSIQYASILDTLVTLAHNSIPRRLEDADSLLILRHPYPSTAPANSHALSRNLDQLWLARIENKHNLAERAAIRIQELNDRLTIPDRSTRVFWGLRQSIQRAYDYMSWRNAKAILSSSNIDEYINLRASAWEKVTRGTVQNENYAIGKVAAQLQSDEYFSEKNTLSSHEVSQNPAKFPIPNRLNLLVFLGHECYASNSIGLPYGTIKASHCQRTISTLKRLNTRFHDLEILVAVQTHGYFSYLGPLKETEEASFLRTWIHDHQNIPGSLVVTYTPHFFLPAPDNRRIEVMPAHITSYAFGNKSRRSGLDYILPQTSFLISADGRILHSDRLVTGNSMFSEQEFTDLIEASLYSSSNQKPSSVDNKKLISSSTPIADSTSEITESDIDMVLSLVEGILESTGEDQDKLRKVIVRLITQELMHVDDSSRLAMFEELNDDIPHIKEIMSAIRNGQYQPLSSLFKKLFNGYLYIDTEKRNGVDQARANRDRSGSAIRLSEAEIEVIRKYYDRITNSIYKLMGSQQD